MIYVRTVFITIIAVSFSFLIAHFKLISFDDTSIMESFFSVFGTMYAIMVGFVILMVSTYYHTIKNAISDEINAIQDLHDYLIYIDDDPESVKIIKASLCQYVHSIVEKEWPIMQSKQETEIFTSEELFNLMRSINTLDPKNQSDLVALEQIMNEVNAITTFRTDRLTMSNENLPPLLVHVSFILSVSVVVSFLFMPIESFIFKITFNAILSFAVGLIYYMILDLNNPFRGDWRVTAKSYKKLLKRLETDTHQFTNNKD